jgi:uncharacterized protein YacL
MMIIVRVLFVLLSCALGCYLGREIHHPLLGALLFGAGAGLLVVGEIYSHLISVKLLFLGSIGLLGGLILANLIVISFLYFPGINKDIYPYICFPLALVLSFLGISLFIKRGDEILASLSLHFFRKGKENSVTSKILDTSVIIDGRIADICEKGFIEGVLILPRFVLRELQKIADSPDNLKRNRGRRGLEILSKIQKRLDVRVQIHETDFPEIKDVDIKLIKLAQATGATILTNDYNLNKIAELEGIKVLNINELAEALKPVVLPGEEMQVNIIKEGKEHGQGIGYLDDGTMVVVDNGYNFIGQKKRVVVTSVLQTTAGRMIFTKIEGQHRDK